MDDQGITSFDKLQDQANNENRIVVFCRLRPSAHSAKDMYVIDPATNMLEIVIPKARRLLLCLIKPSY